MNHTLRLFKQNGSWMVRDNDPLVYELFKTTDIPTSFMDSMPFEEVRELLQQTNPDTLIERLFTKEVVSNFGFHLTNTDKPHAFVGKEIAHHFGFDKLPKSLVTIV